MTSGNFCLKAAIASSDPGANKMACAGRVSASFPLVPRLTTWLTRGPLRKRERWQQKELHKEMRIKLLKTLTFPLQRTPNIPCDLSMSTLCQLLIANIHKSKEVSWTVAFGQWSNLQAVLVPKCVCLFCHVTCCDWFEWESLIFSLEPMSASLRMQAQAKQPTPSHLPSKEIKLSWVLKFSPTFTGH